MPKLLFHIISQIVETVAEELSRLMSCVTKFNNYGKLQARIDISGLQRVLHHFMTDNAKYVVIQFVSSNSTLERPHVGV